MSLVDTELAEDVRRDWFSKSFYTERPPCVIVASLIEDGSLGNLIELDRHISVLRTRECWTCVHFTDNTDDSIICKLHQDLLDDDNLLKLSLNLKETIFAQKTSNW